MRKLFFIISLFFAVSCIGQVPSIGAFQIPAIKEQEDGDCVEYGYLYNWYAATDIREISSSDDWALPTNVSLLTLANSLGGAGIAGGKLKSIGTTYWNSPNTGATNESGFNARGNGIRSSDGTFSHLKDYNRFWGISTNNKIVSGRCEYNSDDLNWTLISIGGEYDKSGLAIRLIYTGVGMPTSYTGNDGRVYNVVLIGTQYWLAKNLVETLYRNGDPIPTVEDNATWAGLTTGAKCAYDNNYEYVGCDETGN